MKCYLKLARPHGKRIRKGDEHLDTTYTRHGCKNQNRKKSDIGRLAPRRPKIGLGGKNRQKSARHQLNLLLGDDLKILFQSENQPTLKIAAFPIFGRKFAQDSWRSSTAPTRKILYWQVARELSKGDAPLHRYLKLAKPDASGFVLNLPVSIADFADGNRKLLAVISAILLGFPAIFLVAVIMGVLLHIALFAFNAVLIRGLSLISGGTKSAFAKKENASALLLVASQKTLPVMVAVVDQLGNALGEPGLLVLPCVAAHLNQIIIDSFLVSLWKPKEGEFENAKIA
ncbi:hypothetical protein ACS0TY_009611 [Phlomoides rotata]